MTATKKISVSIVEDRILAEINQRAAARLRERLREMFVPGYWTPPTFDVVRDVAARHADDGPSL